MNTGIHGLVYFIRIIFRSITSPCYEKKHVSLDEKHGKKFGVFTKTNYLCTHILDKEWAFSSAGLEHLPYKQRVGGSNPSTPTPRVLLF